VDDRAVAEFIKKAAQIRAHLLEQASAEPSRGWLERLILALRRFGRP
jgi:hypothetical protein